MANPQSFADYICQIDIKLNHNSITHINSSLGFLTLEEKLGLNSVVKIIV